MSWYDTQQEQKAADKKRLGKAYSKRQRRLKKKKVAQQRRAEAKARGKTKLAVRHRPPKHIPTIDEIEEQGRRKIQERMAKEFEIHAWIEDDGACWLCINGNPAEKVDRNDLEAILLTAIQAERNISPDAMTLANRWGLTEPEATHAEVVQMGRTPLTSDNQCPFEARLKSTRYQIRYHGGEWEPISKADLTEKLQAVKAAGQIVTPETRRVARDHLDVWI